MRKALIMLAVITLAACNNGTAPADKAEPAGNDVTLPEYVRGNWAIKGTSCNPDSDSRIAISANQIDFHESIATVTKAESGDMDSVIVDVDLAAEGDTSKERYSLTPGEGGTELTLTMLGNDNSETYSRCPN